MSEDKTTPEIVVGEELVEVEDDTPAPLPEGTTTYQLVSNRVITVGGHEIDAGTEFATVDVRFGIHPDWLLSMVGRGLKALPKE